QMEPMFSPALHRQRHQFVIDFVSRNKPRKVVDLGCSECSLLSKLRFRREIELLVGVDINGAKVKKHMHRLAPISTEYLQPSFDQLHIELYQGSVTQKDTRLRGFDLVTSIELIEHLTLADVECFSEVVFGYMTPVAAIVSTPNSEFNPLFPGLASGFRHRDHKFEWTRAEFRSWALKVCLKFGYEVEFSGVGEAPSGQQEQVGFCSQIGVFHRLGGRDGFSMLLDEDSEDVFSYTLLHSINYPSLRDNNILQRVLVSEVLYQAEKLKRTWTVEETDVRNDICTLYQTERQGEACFSKQHVYVSIPLAVLWACSPKVSALSGSLNNLRHLLLDDPRVKLSTDGSAVLVNYEEQDIEEEGDDNNVEDSGHAEASQHSHSTVLEEDWETNV
uniref:Small RNA 2'-O-methyltransferase n=1 Tax=Mastacembelus armatus TaxID=205130 RepID=A0A3Q3M5U3_9TELE